MMKGIAGKILIGLLIFVTGCVSASVVRYPNAQYPPTDSAEVQVYQSAPPMKYERIGEVSATGAPLASMDSIYGKLKAKAAEIGGHAIINLKTSHVYSSVDQYGNISSDKVVTGIVIRFTEDTQKE